MDRAACKPDALRPHALRHPVKWLAQRVVTTHIASIPLFAASVMLALGNPDGLFVLVGAFFFSFVAGVVGVWVLPIEILR